MAVKVSIIIPFYNVEEFVHTTLDSVIRQSMKDIEIICVDDCSTDRTCEILEEYASRDSRIHVIRHATNLSTSQSRKDGVLASTGKYIMFLDGDDEFYPDACQVAYDAIEEAGTDVVQFDTRVVGVGNVGEARINSTQKTLRPFLKVIKDSNLLKECWIKKRFSFTLWNKIYQGTLCRDAFKQVEDGSFPRAQDMYAFFVFSHYAQSYKGISAILYKYNLGPGVSGQDDLPLSKFSALLTQHNVIGALRRFSRHCDLEEELNPIIDDIEYRFLRGTVYIWDHNLSIDAQSKGFDDMIASWGIEKVFPILVEFYWGNEQNLNNKIGSTSAIRIINRDMADKKTIAFYYFKVRNGGAERATALLASHLANIKNKEGQYRYKIILVTDEADSPDDYELSPLVDRAYIPAFGISAGKDYVKRFIAWQDLIKEYKVDAVISGLWLNPCTYWDELAIKSSNLHPACLLIQHGFFGSALQSVSLKGMQIASNFTLCDGIVTLSECDKLFAKTFNANVHCIYNLLTFDPERVTPSKYEKNSIIWVGRISPEKNPLDAIRMMDVLLKKIPNAELTIIGDGDEILINSVIDEIHRLKLEEHIKMTGYTNDIGQFYQNASLLISTSKFESFSMTFTEAMSYAVPIVTYNLPWLDLIRFGKGIISVPQGDFSEMANVVADLLNQPEKVKILGEDGKNYVKGINDIEIEQKWITLLDTTLEGSVDTEQINSNPNIDIRNILKFSDAGIANRMRSEQRGALSREKAAIDSKQKQINQLLRNYETMKNSNSYQLGRMLTFIPRKIRKFLMGR